MFQKLVNRTLARTIPKYPYSHIPSQSRLNYSIISFSFLLLRVIISSNLRHFFCAESDPVDPQTPPKNYS
jgi:hypothetical protein